MSRKVKIPGIGHPFEIVWDRWGIPHVFAKSIDDAYAGMGFVAGHERLWQAHLSCLYANAEAASELGAKFIRQDALMRTLDVPGRQVGRRPSDGDGIAEAYLAGLNAAVDALDDVPPEFEHARTSPRHFTLDDVAARYRFTSWFQHRSWLEKIITAKLMAEHGTQRWKGHLRRFSSEDGRLFEELREAYRRLEPAVVKLLFPLVEGPVAPSSGSNNWAVRAERSASGMPLLATDPHQAFSIPNTFFYVHLSAPGFDVFGASFPGMPYFMMGHTRRLAWGLTTGFTDNYDVYIEALTSPDSIRYRTPCGDAELERREELIRVKDADDVVLPVVRTRHGPLLEPLLETLGLAAPRDDEYRTALSWALGERPSSAGILGRLPLAKDAREFGEYLFEDDVTPLVNNIICVDADNDLRRWVVATMPKRIGVTGVLPLAGWNAEHDFELSLAADMLVEHNPASGCAATANNDTMGERGAFPIHNYPSHPARADRIFELLETKEQFTRRDFQEMQLDLMDRRARDIATDVVQLLAEIDDERVEKACGLLAEWDYRATPDSIAASVYAGLLNSRWHETFLTRALESDNLDASLVPALRGCPALAGAWQIENFLAEGSPWIAHRDLLRDTVAHALRTVIERLEAELGDDPRQWQWGRLKQVKFWHTLSQQEKIFEHMVAGPSPLGGSPNTLAMAVHMGKGPGVERDADELPYRAMHGPVFRMVVDLADPSRTAFVICGGNSARPQSTHVLDMFPLWLAGDYATVRLERSELDRSPEAVWQVE